MFMSSDTVAEQLTDCLPQLFRADLFVKERYLKKQNKKQNAVHLSLLFKPVSRFMNVSPWSAVGASLEMSNMSGSQINLLWAFSFLNSALRHFSKLCLLYESGMGHG